MLVVDSHCHASPVWYEPVETLLDQMDRNEVAQAVLVQILGQFDNAYQQRCRQYHRDRFASVIAVDASRADAVHVLTQLAEEGASGLRLRPESRSPGDDPLAVWRAAESLNLAVSCVGTPETFAASAFYELIGDFPDLPVVLEHLGGTSRPHAGNADPSSRSQVFELAKFPNVYLKVPGLGELVPRNGTLTADGIPLDPCPEILRLALERFGPDRLMWGSDFPPVAAREGYRNALQWVREALADLSPDSQSRIFGDTARRVFKLPST